MKQRHHPNCPRACGEVTRGKTAPERLRRVDNFLMLYEPALLRRRDGEFSGSLFVDLGFGEHPGTTLESAARFRRLNPKLAVLGVDIAAERVAAARAWEAPGLTFRQGGFNLPLEEGERVRLIRAFNVLRQYPEERVAGAAQLLGSYLLPGGLLIEGTSNPTGSLWVANLLRQSPARQLEWEALIFSINLKYTSAIEALQTVLPKNLIHHMLPGEGIHTFFCTWKGAWQRKLSQGLVSYRQLFAASVRILKQSGYNLLSGRRWLRRGYLVWLRPGVIQPGLSPVRR